ncbi:hypothetical protein EK21DRAFT_88011 [Setomelanomma holmii]|uniref:Uncharacterized protein n=1 Tax=Setomelanomma holmii TaxID=210430 RepID=A0A9P4LQ53_9PLEO|nr:hypothetical protein EK21DRAFT_88011 [Setomelanomma holmii]
MRPEPPKTPQRDGSQPTDEGQNGHKRNIQKPTSTLFKPKRRDQEIYMPPRHVNKSNIAKDSSSLAVRKSEDGTGRGETDNTAGHDGNIEAQVDKFLGELKEELEAEWEMEWVLQIGWLQDYKPFFCQSYLLVDLRFSKVPTWSNVHLLRSYSPSPRCHHNTLRTIIASVVRAFPSSVCCRMRFLSFTTSRRNSGCAAQQTTMPIHQDSRAATLIRPMRSRKTEHDARKEKASSHTKTTWSRKTRARAKSSEESSCEESSSEDSSSAASSFKDSSPEVSSSEESSSDEVPSVSSRHKRGNKVQMTKRSARMSTRNSRLCRNKRNKASSDRESDDTGTCSLCRARQSPTELERSFVVYRIGDVESLLFRAYAELEMKQERLRVIETHIRNMDRRIGRAEMHLGRLNQFDHDFDAFGYSPFSSLKQPLRTAGKPFVAPLRRQKFTICRLVMDDRMRGHSPDERYRRYSSPRGLSPILTYHQPPSMSTRPRSPVSSQALVQYSGPRGDSTPALRAESWSFTVGHRHSIRCAYYGGAGPPPYYRHVDEYSRSHDGDWTGESDSSRPHGRLASRLYGNCNMRPNDQYVRDAGHSSPGFGSNDRQSNRYVLPGSSNAEQHHNGGYVSQSQNLDGDRWYRPETSEVVRQSPIRRVGELSVGSETRVTEANVALSSHPQEAEWLLLHRQQSVEILKRSLAETDKLLSQTREELKIRELELKLRTLKLDFTGLKLDDKTTQLRCKETELANMTTKLETATEELEKKTSELEMKQRMRVVLADIRRIDERERQAVAQMAIGRG